VETIYILLASVPYNDGNGRNNFISHFAFRELENLEDEKVRFIAEITEDAAIDKSTIDIAAAEITVIPVTLR